MSEQKREMSADEYVQMAKIDSLAKQNAGQALRIADLEAQLSLYQQQQAQAHEGMVPYYCSVYCVLK